jgi:hypothetical protein
LRGTGKKRGYMVCTGNYVARNTRKQRRAARSSAENRLSPIGGPPQESLCMRDMTRGSAGKTVSLNIRSVDLCEGYRTLRVMGPLALLFATWAMHMCIRTNT